MKKKVITIAIIVIMVLVNVTVVRANSIATVTVKTSSTEVKPGEIFKITLAVKCDDGINGLDTTYSYDNNLLELQSATVADTTKWSSLGTGSSITVICNSSEKITDSDIYVLTFKVKEEATIGSEATINIGNITVDMDVTTNSKINIKEQIIKTKIAQITNNTESTTTEDGSNDNNNSNNTNNNNSNNNSNGTITNNNSNNTNNGKTTTENNTINANKLPQTGTDEIIVAVTIGVGIVIAIMSFISYSRYRNI